jgi:hypothetical protein
MRETIYNDIKYVIGQNAKENYNILDQAYKINCDYIWFHLNSFPSCFVIMYSTLYELKPNNIHDYLTHGANLCKQNTKYRNLADLKICYTQLKKLKKTNKIGEIIISGKRNIIKL